MDTNKHNVDQATCRSSRQRAMPRLRCKHLAMGVALALGTLACGTTMAAAAVSSTETPTGGRVVGGKGSIVQQDARTIINQQSHLLALDWQTFNVGKDASVRFKQPSLSAVALNRILDQNPSKIFGKVTSNGQIFLINTHGIIFGRGAQLNVGGLVASTLDLTPDDFLKEHFNLDAHGGHAGIINHGTIAAASGGSITLIGGHVANDGLILADYGHINLDGARRAVLDFDGNGLINVQITGALQQRLKTEKAAVVNQGTLRAESGTVVLKAAATKDLFTNLVNHSGVIRAGGISTDGGVVRLVGSGGNVVSSGRINVSGTHGGSVHVLSDQGVVASGRIHADATGNGDGGFIMVKGDGQADISGQFSARGGVQGGDGGFVETSGRHVHVADSTRVSTQAPLGQAGTWLIDPRDFTIAASGGDISGATLGGNLGAGNVVIESSSGGTAGNGDIFVNDAVNWSANKLTLTAANDIHVNAVLNGSGTSSLTLNAATANGADAANPAGAIRLAADITTGGQQTYNGAVTLNSSTGSVALTGDGVKFADTLDNSPGATQPQSLTVDNGSGQARFEGVVGGAQGALGALTVSGTGQAQFYDSVQVASLATMGSALLYGNVTTGGGAQTYGGALFLADPVVLVSNGGDVTFEGAVENFDPLISKALTVDANSGAVAFEAAVGANGPIGALSINGSGGTSFAGTVRAVSLSTGTGSTSLGGNVTTTGAQAYNGAVTLNSDVTLTTTDSNLSFAGTLDNATNGTPQTLMVDVGTGAVTFGGVVGAGSSGPLASLQATGGHIVLTGTAVNTIGSQTYDGAVIVNNPVTLTGEGVTFNGKVDSSGGSGPALTVNGGSGAVHFDGAVGSEFKLGALTLSGSGATTFADTVEAASLVTGTGLIALGGNVTTAGAQTYNGAVTLNSDVTLTTTDNNVDFAGTVDNATSGTPQALAISTGAGNVTFGDAVGGTSGPLGALALNGSGATTFAGMVKAASLFTGTGLIELGGNVTTTGAQSYNGAVTLNSNTGSVTLTGDAVKFADTLDNSPGATQPQSLTVDNGSGQARFEGVVGGAQGALGALTVSGTGQAQFYDSVQVASLATMGSALLYGNVTTGGGAQTYGGALFLADPVVLVSNGGDVTFEGAVENFDPLISKALTVDANSGAVAFEAAVGADGPIGALSISGSGGTSFAGTVKAVSLSTGTGSTSLGGNVTTTGAQAYNGAVTLNSDVTLTTTDSNLSFYSTLDNATSGPAQALAVDVGTGTVVFAGMVGAGSGGPLASLQATGDGFLLGGSAINTVDSQTYDGYVLLVADTVLSGNGVSFLKTVDSSTTSALTVNGGSGAVHFDGAVGGAFKLGSLTIHGSKLVANALHIGNGGLSVTTAADITQGGAFTVTGASSFDAGAHAIMLDNNGNDFTGPVSLANTGNNDVYLGNGGHALILGPLSLGKGALTLTDYGTTPLLLTSTITTDGGAVNFGGAITVGGSSGVSIDTTGGGSAGANIGFGGDINAILAGGNSLSLDAGNVGVVSFGGDVGNAVALDDLTVTAKTVSVPSMLSVAGDLSITSVDALTTGSAWSGANVALTTTGTNSDLTLNGSVIATAGSGTVVLDSGAGISQSGTGTITANTLIGSSVGTTTLDGNNAIVNLGGFTANGFILSNGQALTVTGAVDGGTGSVNLATTSGALTLNAAVNGSAVTLAGSGGVAINAAVNSGNGVTHLTSGGTITENGGGTIAAGTLTGNSANATALTGNNTIADLGTFIANGFSLTNAQALEVTGPVSGGAGLMNLATTNGALTINGAVDGGTVSLDGNGGLAINAIVNSAGGVALTSGGTIAENGSGTIHATTLTGSSVGAAHLDGANMIGSLGNFAANGFSLSNGAALAVDGTVDGGTAGTALATTAGDLTINGTVGNTGGATALNSAGAIAEDVNAIVKANTLTGSSVGATSLTGSNQVDNLGDFTANGLSFTNAQALTVAAGSTVDGGANGTTLTTTAGDLSINGTVGNTTGTTTLIASAGAIGEGASGIVKANTLTGSSQGDTKLVGNNQIDKLATFSAANLALVDARDLSVVGPVSTTNGTGDISFTTTTGNKLDVGLVLTGGTITLDSGSDLNVTNDIQASAVNLAATGNLAINAMVDSGAGTTTLVQNGTGTISEGPAGSMVAGTLTGSATGSATLDGNNAIDNLGNFTADGFALTNGQALTLEAGTTVDGGSTVTLTTTGAGSDLTIDGLLRGTSTELVSSGAIGEGAGGVVQAGTLTGSSSGATALVGTNAIDSLGNFTADGFALTNGQVLTVADGVMIDGGASTSLTTTGANSDLAINGTVKGVDTSLVSSGNIDEGTHGIVIADTLTGSSIAATSISGTNTVANLGDFSANGFVLNNSQALTVVSGASVNGGHDTRLTTTGAGSDLTINGNITGMATKLVSAGAIREGAGGSIHAGTFTGSAVHGAHLTGTNAIDSLGDFTAAGLALTNGQSVTITGGATVDGGTDTTLTTTGANSNLTLNGTLKGATTTLLVSGAIKEGKNGVLDADTLTGSSGGSTALTGDNDVVKLGNFTAKGFALTTDPGLTVTAGSTVNGGDSTTLTTTGSGNDLAIDGIVQGDTVKLVSSGAIGEGSAGRIRAGTLTGRSVGDATFTGVNQIDALGAFNAKNFNLTNARALVVSGPLATTHGAGDVNLTTTGGTGNTLTVNQAIHGDAITLASAGDLTVANAVTGTQVDLASNGNLAINARVDSGAGTTTLTQKGSGGISGSANGGITAGTLTGSATGATTLGSSAQFMDNRVDVLGGFSSPGGFSLTNGQTLTLASVNGSAFTVDAGTADTYLGVRNGDLLQQGTTWLYNGYGTWASSGHIGLSNAPIYVTGVGNQTVASIGKPPAYFYAVDRNGGFLPLTGGQSVNVPTAILTSRSQGVNGHGGHYIDISAVTATYRAYGVVQPGLLLPRDQWQCSPDQLLPGYCPRNL